jgi:FixJ family two-component response regulator
MPNPTTPIVWLAQSEAGVADRLALDLRQNGMVVVVFASTLEALAALTQGGRPAVLVTEPLRGPLTDLEFTEQVKVIAPRASIVFTPQGETPRASTPGTHVLVHPFDGAKLSRFIRLAAGRPAVRGALQALYREAHPHAAERAPA